MSGEESKRLLSVAEIKENVNALARDCFKMIDEKNDELFQDPRAKWLFMGRVVQMMFGYHFNMALVASSKALDEKEAEKQTEICRDCDGNGYTNPPTWTVKCKRCEGKGVV